eukprot:PhF_6_TR26171/c1_g1_i3/m.37168
MMLTVFLWISLLLTYSMASFFPPIPQQSSSTPSVQTTIPLRTYLQQLYDEQRFTDCISLYPSTLLNSTTINVSIARLCEDNFFECRGEDVVSCVVIDECYRRYTDCLWSLLDSYALGSYVGIPPSDFQHWNNCT